MNRNQVNAAAQNINESAIDFTLVVLGEPLARFARALYVGTGGTLEVTSANGSTATFTNVPDGSLLPISAAVVEAGTTAGDIIALH